MMDKHNKINYFEKMKLLISVCVSDITTAKDLISSEVLSFKDNSKDVENIFNEIKTNLAKDYFTPFEREDILIISIKLKDLYSDINLLCKYSAQSDFFGFPSFIVSLAEKLTEAVNSLSDIINKLSEYPKQGEMQSHFTNTETLLSQLQKTHIDCLYRTKNNEYNHILYTAGRCSDICNETVQLLQYILIKNS